MNTNLAALSIEYSFERIAMRVLFAILGVVLCGYLYFVGASVLNIIARKEAVRQSQRLKQTVGENRLKGQSGHFFNDTPGKIIA